MTELSDTQPGCGEMVERGARILEPQAWAALGLCDTLAYKSRRTSSLRKARAFIEAMREPTEGIIDAGWEHTGDPCWEEDVAEAWRAMIDAALSPPTEPVKLSDAPNTDPSPTQA